ncbi:MAG: hypothetical protein ACE5I7_12020, partial [Candidatus Binatia bacterium]
KPPGSEGFDLWMLSGQGSIGIVAVNFWIAEPGAPEPSDATGQASSVVFTFVPSDWDLDAGTYSVRRFNQTSLAWDMFGTLAAGSKPYSTPPISIPAVVDPNAWAPASPIEDLTDNPDAVVVLRIDRQ